VSFEDPDGSILNSLLLQRHLFAFGAQLTVRKWRPPIFNNVKIQTAAAKRRERRLTAQANARNLVREDPAVTASTAEAHARASLPPVPESLRRSIPPGPSAPPRPPPPAASAVDGAYSLTKTQRKKKRKLDAAAAAASSLPADTL
jgi:hypothetical protein